MTVVVAAVVGFLAARLLWLVLRSVLATDLFLRENYRGHRLPTGAGVVLALAVVVVESARMAIATITGDPVATPLRTAVLLLAVGLAFVGLLDDLAGTRERRGFRGHVGALVEGRLTTGALKLLGGGALAVIATALARPPANLGELLADAAVIALAANLANLFDVAPGRAIKVGGAAFVALAAATVLDARLAAPAVVVGGALGLLLDDLRERLMLGDAGANVLGGAVGLGLVVTASPTVRLAALAVLLVLNGASEWVSFGRVVDRVGVLRALDRAGRRR